MKLSDKNVYYVSKFLSGKDYISLFLINFDINGNLYANRIPKDPALMA